MGKLKFAIVGCRHLHIMDFVKEMTDLGHDCIGIYEPDNERLRSILKREYQLPVIEDLETLFKSDIDIVGCASINREKIDVIEKCEQHRIHVMVDKPIVTSKEDLDRLEKVMKRKLIQVGMMLTERFQPAFFTLQRLIENGDLGKITHISMRKPHRLSAENREPWFFSKEQSGGMIIDLLIHDFDLIGWLTEKSVTHVHGYMTKSILPEYPDFYDTASLSVLLDHDLPVQLYVDWLTPKSSWTWGDGRVFVTGTMGTVELRLQGDPFVEKECLCFYMNDDLPLQKVELRSPAFGLAEDFIERINGDEGFINHKDILRASKDVLLADDSVQRLHSV